MNQARNYFQNIGAEIISVLPFQLKGEYSQYQTMILISNCQ